MNRRSLSIRTALFVLGFAHLTWGAVGCGYTLQNSRSNSLREEGIEKIYIAPVKNLTFKPGLENVFYNELVQILRAGRRVKIVERPENSDAILQAQVVQAVYVPTASTSADSIFPVGVPAILIPVATEYQADVTSSFLLSRQKAGMPTTAVWESGFTRSRRFAANNQKIEYGSTSGLINESEFERTIREIAHGMMMDVHEAMLARF